LCLLKKQARMLINSVVYRCFERWPWECNVMCSHDQILMLISWVLYCIKLCSALDLSLVDVWYVRKGFELLSHVDMDFSIWNSIWIWLIFVYAYIWWQIPHLYNLWNMNKWMNEWTQFTLSVCTMYHGMYNCHTYKHYVERLCKIKHFLDFLILNLMSTEV
jgi:hypothetical protein